MITKVVSESLIFLPGEVLHLIITIKRVVNTIGSNFQETDLKRLGSQMNTWQIRSYMESGLPDPKRGSLNYSTTLISLCFRKESTQIPGTISSIYTKSPGDVAH